ncbi:MAG: SDR family oxidoreductase [Fodinibius sp.]|nr:SDR family oxidoreductase [Fodinibius sp.]
MADQQGYGLLEGKKGIIFGALDDRSIAWRIALACKREGAEFALSNAPVALRFGDLDELAEQTESSIYPCDVSKEENVEELMEKVKDEYGKIDFMLHAIGMSPNVRKDKGYEELNYQWLQQTLDISAVSLHKIIRYADEKEILNDGASILALSYIGAQRIFSKYSDMNDAKALLESIARNYGSRLADRGIRVNTVSQAPTKTSAGSGIRWFRWYVYLCRKAGTVGQPHGR